MVTTCQVACSVSVAFITFTIEFGYRQLIAKYGFYKIRIIILLI